MISAAREEVSRVAAPLHEQLEHLLVLDADAGARGWVRSVLAGHFVIEEAASSEVALDRIASGCAGIVIIGKYLDDISGSELVSRAAPWLRPDRRRPATFLLGDGNGECAHVADDVLVSYRLLRSMPADRVRALVTRAAAALPTEPPRTPDPLLSFGVSEHVSRVATAQDAQELATAMVAAVGALVEADRARCLYCDDETGAIWPSDDTSTEIDASQGLVGFVARVIVGMHVPTAASDAMYVRRVDDPEGDGSERLALQPVVGPDGHVHAVLVAVRSNARPAFDAHDLARLEAFAVAVSPYLMQLELQLEADAIIGDELERGRSEIFRQEAIATFVRRGHRGDVVRVHPRWVGAAYWLVLCAFAAAAAFVAIARIPQYTDGSAIVRYTDRKNVVATESGTVASIEVARGQRIHAGEVMARFDDLEQRARLRALETDFERKLVAYLQSPADPGVRQGLAQVVSQRETTLAGAESRLVRAPDDGFVGEVMVHRGQHVTPGAVMMSIAHDNDRERLSLLAFLPGRDRPRLHAGQTLRLRLPGYRSALVTAKIAAISSEVLGLEEARRRYLPDGMADSVSTAGPVVVVEAHLQSPEFEADGHRFVLHDGMVGRVEVELETQSLFHTLWPGAR